MKTKILTVMSALALMSATQAFAAEDVSKNNTTSTDVQRDVKDAVADIKHDTQEAYEDIKAYFLGNEKGAEISEMTINSRLTANGMIGKIVHNSREESVGMVKDIILDAGGNALMVIVSDGEFTGFEGKLVALDYNLVSVRNADGDVIAPLTEETINKASAFSYEPKDAAKDVRVIPDKGISIVKLLEGQLVDAEMNPIAEIDNISLKNGHASELIVGFDKVLGLGGQKVALDYDDAKLVRVDDDFDFQLSANQAAQFETYKKSVTN